MRNLSLPASVEWAKQTGMVDHIKTAFLAGELQISGRTPVPEAPPEGSVAALASPSLTLCSMQGVGADAVLVVPEAIDTKWHNNERHGRAFTEWVDEAKEAGIISAGEAGQAKKKRRISTGDAQPAAVKEELVPAALPETMLGEMRAKFKTLQQHSVILTTRAQLNFTECGKVFIVNPTEATVVLPAWTTIAEYYKGSWMGRKLSDVVDKQIINYKIDNDQEMIHCGGHYASVRSILDNQRDVDPFKVKLAYHVIEEAPPMDPGKLTITLKHDHRWRKFERSLVKAEPLVGEDGLLQQKHMAGLVGVDVWKTSFTAVVWMTRWTAKGITPVRPLIAVSRDVLLEAGCCV